MRVKFIGRGIGQGGQGVQGSECIKGDRGVRVKERGYELS